MQSMDRGQVEFRTSPHVLDRSGRLPVRAPVLALRPAQELIAELADAVRLPHSDLGHAEPVAGVLGHEPLVLPAALVGSVAPMYTTSTRIASDSSLAEQRQPPLISQHTVVFSTPACHSRRHGKERRGAQ